MIGFILKRIIIILAIFAAYYLSGQADSIKNKITAPVDISLWVNFVDDESYSLEHALKYSEAQMITRQQVRAKLKIMAWDNSSIVEALQIDPINSLKFHAKAIKMNDGFVLGDDKLALDSKINLAFGEEIYRGRVKHIRRLD